MKRLFSLIVCIAILVALSPAVLAASATIQDDAGLLSANERAVLSKQAESLCEEFDVSVVIVTIDTLAGDQTWEVCDRYFYNGGFSSDGVLLLLSMEYRDWEIATYGTVAGRISNSRTEKLFDAISDDLADDRYFEGFSVYLSELEKALSQKSYSEKPSFQLLVSLIVGAVAALIAILVMRSKMNTVQAQSSANDYIQQGSYRLTVQHDMFLYSNVSKVRRSQNSSSGGGGGGGSRGGSRGKF